MNRSYQAVLLIVLFFFTVSFTSSPCHRPLLTVAGGYFFGGPHHSGGGAEIEYRSANRCFRYFRPQATLLFPEFKGAFIGAGLGIEFHFWKHLIFIPSFEPGFYFQGKSRNLGSPIEFRSCAEFAFEKNNGIRLGIQYYHLSNARLGNHNPGINALMLGLSFPL